MSIETLAMQAMALVTLALLLGAVAERAMKKPEHRANGAQAARSNPTQR